MVFLFLLILLLVFLVAITASIIRALLEKHADDVQIVIYVSCLAFVVAAVVAWWAVASGALDPHHGFTATPAGRILQFVMEVVIDLKADLWMIAGIVCILIVPQLLAYLACMPFGCSSRPWLIGPGMTFMLWSVVKFFAVMTGVMANFAVMDIVFWEHDWTRELARGPLALILSGVPLCVALFVLLMYREGEAIASLIGSRCPKPLLEWLQRMDAWARRHRRPIQITVSVTIGEAPPIAS